MTITTPETAYRALQHAAEKLGRAEYRRQLDKSRGKRLRRFTPTGAHNDLVEAMPLVLSGAISVEDAMSMMHYGETGEALRRLAS